MNLANMTAKEVRTLKNIEMRMCKVRLQSGKISQKLLFFGRRQ